MSSSSPTYAYRLATLHHLEEADEFDRLGMMRSNRLLDSAAAGGLAGGVLSSVASELSATRPITFSYTGQPISHLAPGVCVYFSFRRDVHLPESSVHVCVNHDVVSVHGQLC
jgi:hypothetical protein